MSDHETIIPLTVDGALTALRDTLEHDRPDPSAFARVEDPLRVLCSRAHEEGITPEHLIVRLKQALDVVPGFDGRLPETQEKDMRERIVSRAIDMYFSGPEEVRGDPA